MSIEALKKEKETECIYFNGWLFEDYEDAKIALLGSILDTIEKKRTLDQTAKICIAGLYKSIDKLLKLPLGKKRGKSDKKMNTLV